MTSLVNSRPMINLRQFRAGWTRRHTPYAFSCHRAPLQPLLAAYDQLADALFVSATHIDRHQQPFPAGAKDNFPDSMLSCLECVSLAAIAQHEPNEVAKAIEEHLAYFASEFMLGDFADLFGRDAVGRGEDAVGVAAETIHPCCDVADIAFEHRIPSVGRAQLLEPPLHDGERVLLRKQHHFPGCDGDLHLKRADNVTPGPKLPLPSYKYV